MTHNTFKLLGATTALLALASGAVLADDVNANNTAQLQTSTTTTGFNISGSTVVSNTLGQSTIQVSGTTTQNVILVSSSATVQGNTVSGTIQAINTGATANATITNYGAINAIGGNTVAISMSTITGVVTVSGTGTISGSVTTGSGDDVITVEGATGAITGAVSTSTGNDTLTVRNGGTVTGAVDMGTGNNSLIVKDSGSSVVGDISAGTGTTGNDTVSVTSALIHGNVNLASGTNVIQVAGSTGKISGTVTTTGGDDTLTVTNGTVTGAVDLGAGVNTVTVSGTGANIGALTTGASIDTLTLDGARINGNVDLGAGVNTLTTKNSAIISGSLTTGADADTVTLGSGTIISGTSSFGNGGATVSATTTTFRDNVTFGSGTNALYLVNSDVSGTLTMGGTDSVYISGTTPFTQKGAFSGVNSLFISDSTVHANHSLGDVTTMTLQRGAVVNISESQVFSGTGTVNVNNSTVNIAAGKHVSASTWNFTNNGVLGVHVASSASFGSIGASSFNGGSITIRLASNAGYINSGTQMRIISSSGASILPSLTTTTQGVYTFNVASDGSNGVSLTILRAATSSVATNSGNAAIGSVLDTISSTQNAQLLAVQSALGNAPNAAAANEVLESLNPAGGSGAAMANVGNVTATGNQVSNRLAMLRGKGMNTGDGMFSNHVWVQGFGNVTNQDDKDGVKGYDASGYGTSAGVDTDTLVHGMNVGAAFSYGNASVESNAAGNAETDIDSYMLTGYGSKTMANGVFVNGQASLGASTYETSRVISGVGTAKGDFDGIQYGLKGEVGRDYDYEQFTLTPMASVQYTHVDMDAYTETGAGGAGLVVGDQDFDGLDLGLGGQAAWNMPLENGGTLKPTLRAKYIYRAGDDSVETTSRFIGGGANFTTQGVKADKSSMNLGAGLLLTTVGGVDLSADYDADIRSSLTGHTGQVKARWAF